MEAGQQIAQRRRAAGLTQRELAERAGMSLGAIRDLEQGRTSTPQPATFRRLSEVLGMSAQASGLRVQILGPLAATRAGSEVDLGPPRQRSVLALLALHPGETLRRDVIIDALWPETSDAVNALQTHIARLRRILEPDRRSGDRAGVLASVPDGYRLEVAPEELDLLAFRELVVAGRHDEAVRLLRGEPLADIPQLQAHPALTRVRDEWLAAVVAHADQAMAEDAAGRALPALQQAARAEPLHGAVHARLIHALVGSGERARALQIFETFRRRLAEELGVDPDPEVAAAYRFALQAGAVHQLPADIPEFTGREAELRSIVEWGRADPDAVRIIAIEGMGGVGKTRLAIRAAHRLRNVDIELFADLQGFATDHSPSEPKSVLDDFLRQLGVPTGDIPTSLTGRAALFRDRLHGHRTLVVLDNAADADQIRPLIPGDRAVVIVTSRRSLDLDGARSVPLDVFSPAEAVAAMQRIADRVGAEPEAALRVAELCGRIPLAVTLAAQRLASRPQWSVADLADQLQAPDRRLALGAKGLRETFDLSYDGLEPPQQRLFRRLGAHPGPDFTTESAAALIRSTPGEAGAILDRLVDENLVEAEPGRRYRLHDLLREYAVERAGPDTASRIDLLRWYLGSAAAAAGVLNSARRPIEVDSDDYPAPLIFADYDSALAWLEAERVNLVAAVKQAAESGLPDITWRLALALWDLFQLRRYWDDWITTHEIGLTAAREIGDSEAEALLLSKLANAYHRSDQGDRAIECLRTALVIFEQTGDLTGDAGASTNLGLAYIRKGDPAAAQFWLYRALEKSREFGVPINIANALANVGWFHNEQNELETALRYVDEAVAIARESDNKYVYGGSLAILGEVQWKLGRTDDAVTTNQEALAVNRAAGSRIGEADALTTLADIYDRQGRSAEARQHRLEAVPILEDLGDPRLDAVRAKL